MPKTAEPEPSIRRMTPADMGMALAEGWNPGLGDADLFRSFDPDGFPVTHDADGPVAVIAVPCHGPQGPRGAHRWPARPVRRRPALPRGPQDRTAPRRGARGVAQDLSGARVADCGPGAVVTLDLPEPNRAAVRLAEGEGLRPVFETARM